MAQAWGDVRSQHRDAQKTVRVPMRADLIDEIADLEVQAEREKLIDNRPEGENREPVAPGIARRIQELEDELAGSEVAFTFKAIGRREYNKMLADHPPTAEQKQTAEELGLRAQYNNDTFPPALLAASCIAPEGTTVEDMTEVWENWSEGQVSPMWVACLTANMGSADVGPKSQIASAILNGSAQS